MVLGDWGRERFPVTYSKHFKKLILCQHIVRVAVPCFRYFQKLRGEGEGNGNAL